MGGTVEHGGSAGGRDRGAAGRQQGPQSLLPPSAPEDGPQDKVPRRWRRWVGAWRRWSLWTLLVALVAGMLVKARLREVRSQLPALGHRVL